MKVTAFVVDDEPVARAGLRAMLLAFDWVEVIGEAADGVEVGIVSPAGSGEPNTPEIVR